MSSTISAGTTAGSSLAFSGDTSGSLQLQTNGTTTAVTIDTSQNVGIGTAIPATKLHVSTSSAEVSRFESTGTVGYIRVKNSTVESLLLSDSTNGLVKIGSISNTPVVFNTNDTERMRIDSSGNVLVGTTSVLGGTNKLCLLYDGATSGGFLTKTSTNVTYTAANFLNSSSTSVGGIVCTSSATSYNTSSDYRLKDNVTPVTGALATIAQLKPCNYKWIADGSDGQGFIAHEIQAVVPDCVTGEKDAVDDEGKPKYQGIDTSFLVATLTAAIQEQQALIIQLQADVAALKGVKA